MRWTEGEIVKLIELYSDKSNLELSNIFNRDENSIRNKANRLGLNKSKEHISKHISKRNKMVGRDMCYENLDYKIKLISDIDDIEDDISDYVNDFIDNISKYVDVEYNSFNDISELKEYLRNSYDNWIFDLKNENPKEYSELMKRKARKKFNI